MNGEHTFGDEALAQAGDWLVRLQAADLSADDALAFDAWLNAEPANGRAYDHMVSVSRAVEAAAPEIARELSAAQQRLARGLVRRRSFLAVGGLAAAAAVALVVLPQALAPATQTYQTGVGERRTVKLADGSTLDLNAKTRLSVTLARGERHVDMPEGEAIFDVASDSSRPFVIDAGGHSVRVLGTQFDVRHRPDGLTVTVARGLVEVRPLANGAAPAYRLRPGQRLDTGRAGQVKLSHVAPGEAFSWRSGRLIYRDDTLAGVVDDLNRQYARPIRLADAELGSTRISGVLVLDNQADVVRRLTAMLPVSAESSDQGILLRRK